MRLILIYGLGLASLATFSATDPVTVKRGRNHLCAKNYKEFCEPKKIIPRLSDDYACLHMNFDKLTVDCQRYIHTALKDKPCMSDVQLLCKGVQLNLNMHSTCLNEQLSKVSPQCQEYMKTNLSKAKAATAKFEELCKEYIKPCANLGIPKKGECIHALYYADKFGPECKKEADRLMKKKPAY